MNLKILSAALALLCTFAASARAEEVPQWLKDARAREAPLAEPVDVASEDGWLRTKLPGKVPDKVVLQDGSYSLHVALDGETTVSCEVMPGSRDLAGLLTDAATFSFEALEKLNGTVEARDLEATDAGAVGAHPFISLQWLYRASQNGERRVGALKQYVAALDDAVVYCAHNGLGYVKSFEAVTRSLTAHLRTAGEPAPPAHFREVGVVSLDGARVGVMVTTLTRNAEGDTQVDNWSAMLLQAAPGQVVSQSVFEVQRLRPDGSLIGASQSTTTNGELTDDMALERREGARWRASGTISGKPIDVELTAEPSSYVLLARARKQLMARPDPVGASTEALIWSAPDLTRLLPSRATVLAPAGDDGFAVKEEIAGMAMDAVLDKRTGTVASFRMPLGPRVLSIERVYRDGDF